MAKKLPLVSLHSKNGDIIFRGSVRLASIKLVGWNHALYHTPPENFEKETAEMEAKLRATIFGTKKKKPRTRRHTSVKKR